MGLYVAREQMLNVLTTKKDMVEGIDRDEGDCQYYGTDHFVIIKVSNQQVVHLKLTPYYVSFTSQ